MEDFDFGIIDFGDNHVLGEVDDVELRPTMMTDDMAGIMCLLSTTRQPESEGENEPQGVKRGREEDADLLLGLDPQLDEPALHDIAPMEQKSANIQFKLLGINIAATGDKYLNKLMRRFQRRAEKEKWVPKQTKAGKKKAEPPQAVSLVGGQLFINVQGKPSVRIFPQQFVGQGKMTIQGSTRQAIDARAIEIISFLRSKYPNCEAVFDAVLTSTYCGHFVDREGKPLPGLKLQPLNDVLRTELKRIGLNTSFLNTEKDNCVTIFMKDVNTEGAVVQHGDASKCGQLRIFASGKGTGFGVKSAETLDYHWRQVTLIIWKHLDAVSTEYVTKKVKTGAKRTPICGVCKQSGHNKRTCKTKKE
jgi:hypothetical protein